MTDPLRVTDHAVLRYLERVQGQPIEQVREHIRKTCESAHALGAKTVRAEGVRFEMTSVALTTVLPDGTTPSKTSRERTQLRMAR